MAGKEILEQEDPLAESLNELFTSVSSMVKGQLQVPLSLSLLKSHFRFSGISPNSTFHSKFSMIGLIISQLEGFVEMGFRFFPVSLPLQLVNGRWVEMEWRVFMNFNGMEMEWWVFKNFNGYPGVLFLNRWKWSGFSKEGNGWIYAGQPFQKACE